LGGEQSVLGVVRKEDRSHEDDEALDDVDSDAEDEEPEVSFQILQIQ
jgi:hypothetical protein